MVLFRLICPLSFTSSFSFLGLLNIDLQNNAGVLEYVSNDIGFMQEPTVQSGIGSIDSAVNPSLPQTTPIASVNPMQIWMDVFSLIWLAGIVVLLSYSVISYIKIKRQLLTATLVKDNIYESDLIGTAFVCGFIHPKIYVPVDVGDADLSYILEHERTHIRRRDYLIKPVAFLAFILHWFNPLMWLSFALMSRDMEMSCDESVLQKLSQDVKGGYSSSLLSLSVKKNGLFTANPLAFGESHVRARIKNVLNYKKPVFWVIIASVIVLIGAGIALLSNPTDSEPDLSFLNPNSMLSWIGEHEQIKIESSEYGDIAVSGRELAKWLDTAENDWKRKNVSSPYELSPSITIHVNDETINEIRFFESEPTLAMTLYQNEYRYYTIPKEDYSSVAAMAESGYPHVRSITFTEHEDGDDNASVTITDSKTIMRMAVLMQTGEKYSPSLFFDSTQNDIPPVPDYIQINMSGDETCHSYFLYTEDEKNYYIDRPYDHINKIDFNTMKEIITIFTDVGNKKNHIGFEVERRSGQITKEFSSIADFNHDGVKETAKVVAFDDGELFELQISDSEGNIIWNVDAAKTHAGWRSLFLCNIDGEDYLFRYTPSMYQGFCNYHYDLFYLDASSNEIIVDSDFVEFDINFGGQSHGSFNPDKIASFMNEVNAYLENSIVLLNTNESLKFEDEDHLKDTLWWLDSEVGFTYDKTANLRDVLTAYKKYHENGKLQDQTSFDVEHNLEIIMSSPKTSSNPQDYINAHQNEYESFFKYGGEEALQYMLTQFEAGNAEGLRGQIMMQLCKELLGARNNVTDESLSPQEWYNALDIRQEIMLPNCEYDGQDTIEKLVYDTEIERDSASNRRGGFIIVAPKIFGSYEEEDLLKVFVTTYSARYKLFGNTLSQEGGSIIPAAITYRKDANGKYALEKYEQAKDGSEFGPSIREYCTMPASGKEIKGLADKIFKHYTNYGDIRTLLYDNLFKHLKKNGIKDATLTNSRGEVEFFMSNPKYYPQN